MLRNNKDDHGTGLLAELEECHAAIKVRLSDRAPVIRARLAALEAEEADLRQALRKLEAAEKAA